MRLSGLVRTKRGGIAEFVRSLKAEEGESPLPQSYISQLLNGHRSFGEKAARKLERQAALAPGYLDALGDVPYFSRDGAATAPPAGNLLPFQRRKNTGNIEQGPELKGQVPLISWVQAGAFAAAVDNFHPGQADEWIPTTVPIHRHTYALRVRGDSMTNPLGDPTFPDGSVIIVEPEAIESPDKMVGRFVIAKRISDDEATFKKLVKDAGQFFLKPLNPQYPTLTLGEGDVFCGVVREKAMRFF